MGRFVLVPTRTFLQYVYKCDKHNSTAYDNTKYFHYISPIFSIISSISSFILPRYIVMAMIANKPKTNNIQTTTGFSPEIRAYNIMPSPPSKAKKMERMPFLHSCELVNSFSSCSLIAKLIKPFNGYLHEII